ncbi:condensation domain-containing protein, partial [Erwinia amylovora]|uniref:condensation domain-containing protein n=1 Tax=Erwinia amylovora TaxID=552 RepID=UPI003CFE9258
LGAAAPVDFGAEFSAALRRFSRRHGVNPYMTVLAAWSVVLGRLVGCDDLVLAAWSVVLGRLAGCDDLVIGTPVAGRDRAELEPMVGFLVNTLALRIRPQHSARPRPLTSALNSAPRCAASAAGTASPLI